MRSLCRYGDTRERRKPFKRHFRKNLFSWKRSTYKTEKRSGKARKKCQKWEVFLSCKVNLYKWPFSWHRGKGRIIIFVWPRKRSGSGIGIRCCTFCNSWTDTIREGNKGKKISNSQSNNNQTKLTSNTRSDLFNMFPTFAPKTSKQ